MGSKWKVDQSPMLYSCEIPVQITDAVDKDKRIMRKSADPDDLFNFRESRPEIKNPSDIGRIVSHEIRV